MNPQKIKLDVGKFKETNKTGKDNATEAFEPGGGVADGRHALDYEIQDEILPVTMGAKIGNGN
jgi:hypothetical protein